MFETDTHKVKPSVVSASRPRAHGEKYLQMSSGYRPLSM